MGRLQRIRAQQLGKKKPPPGPRFGAGSSQLWAVSSLVGQAKVNDIVQPLRANEVLITIVCGLEIHMCNNHARGGKCKCKPLPVAPSTI